MPETGVTMTREVDFVTSIDIISDWLKAGFALWGFLNVLVFARRV